MLSRPSVLTAPRCLPTHSKPEPVKKESTASSLARNISIVNVPWNRRMETLAVAIFMAALPSFLIIPITTVWLLFVPIINVVIFAYLIFIFFIDKAAINGSRYTKWFRKIRLWTHFKNFFPVTLIKTAELPPDGKYILGYHPHGIFSFGAFASFATDGCGLDTLFPGLQMHLVTLNITLSFPVLREFYLLLGMCSASRKTFHNILTEKGRAIAVVVGGAAESLKSSPKSIDLYLNHRKGFVRQALANEASLVPVLAFGETDTYQVFSVDQCKWAENLQARLQKAMGFALPFFHGRGMFNKVIGTLPFRRPIYVVVGAPIKLPTVVEVSDGKGGKEQRRVAELGERWLFKDEGAELVDRCHREYIEAVRGIYETHKGRYFTDRSHSMVIE